MTDDEKDKEADDIEAELYRRALSGDELAQLFLSKADCNV